MRQKGFTPVLVVVALTLVGLVGIYYFKLKERNTSPITSPAPNSNIPSNWKYYTDDNKKYSFSYPEEWTIDKSFQDRVVVKGSNTRIEFQSGIYPSVVFDDLYNKPEGSTNENPVFIRTKIKNLEIGGYRSTIFTNETSPTNQHKGCTVEITFDRGAPLTMVSLINTETCSSQSTWDILNKVISSIKFTNTNKP